MADQPAERLEFVSDVSERLRAALIHCLLEASMGRRRYLHRSQSSCLNGPSFFGKCLPD